MRQRIFALLMVSLCIPTAMASDMQSRMEQRRREFEQRQQEFRKQFDQRRTAILNQMGTSRSSTGVQTYGGKGASTSGTKGVQTYGGTPAPTSSSSSSRSASSQFSTAFPQHSMNPRAHTDRMKGTEFDPLPFDFKKAPAPDLCFLKFVSAAKSAKTLDELMVYIPFAQQRTLKECQQNWSPQQAAAGRAHWMKTSPSMSQDTLEHLTGPPYAKELKHYKNIGEKFTRIIKSKIIDANHAELEVATQSFLTMKSGGNTYEYPYGTAKVDMIGEGDYWRMKSYNDSNIHYKDPQ